MSETTIAVIQKNTRDYLRLGLSTYKGHKLFFLRVWVLRRDGEWSPTQKGVTCGVAHLPAVIEALQAVYSEAKKVGMVPYDV